MPFARTKKSALLVSVFWGVAFLLYIAYRLWGLSLVNDMYYETSFSFLNEMLEGRDSHSLEFYHAKAERYVYTAITFILLLPLVPLLYPFAASKSKVALESLRRHNKSLTLLGLLLITDLLFIILHLLHAKFGLLTSKLFSIEYDGGYAEVFQYIKESWIALLLLFMAIRARSVLYFSWSLLFAYLLIDDSLKVHERLGTAVASFIDFDLPFGLRAQDFGELSVWAVSAATLFIIIGASHYHADTTGRHFSKHLFFLIVALVFVGVAVDMVHLTDPAWRFFFGLVEDGGEMLIMSLILWFVFRSTYRDQSIPQEAAFSIIKKQRT